MPLIRTAITDQDTGLRAFIVTDSLVGGRAMGGTRLTPAVDLEEVASLAHRMTLKLALADLAIGGAKAGIVCDLPFGPERDRVLAEFGVAVAPFLKGGIYLGTDLGITHRDRDLVFAAAGYEIDSLPCVARLACTWAEVWDRCKDITGFGVCQAIFASSMPGSRKGLDVIIQGFGAVGRAVAVGLAESGYRIVAVADQHGTLSAVQGLPIDALLGATDSVGSIDRSLLPQTVRTSDHPEAWLAVPGDVLVLAAGGNAIRADNVDRVQCGLVVEGANIGCSPAAHDCLAQRGVPVLPDVIVNCGGAAVTGLLLTGSAAPDLTADALDRWLHDTIAGRIRANIAELLERGGTDQRSYPTIATAMARERLPVASPVQPISAFSSA